MPKRSDILLENGVERVKITDFGLARAVEDASATQSGTVAGTPMYVSPEQAEGLPIDQLIGQGENVRLQAKMVSPGRAHVTFRSTKSPAWVAAEALLDHDAPGRLAGALLL